MTQRPVTEDQARDLFVRQLEALSRMGAAPESQARLAAIFAKSEDACRARLYVSSMRGERSPC